MLWLLNFTDGQAITCPFYFEGMMSIIQKTDGDAGRTKHTINLSDHISVADNIVSESKANPIKNDTVKNESNPIKNEPNLIKPKPNLIKPKPNPQFALDAVIGKMLQHPCYMFSCVHSRDGSIYFTYDDQKYRLVLENV